MARQNDDQMTDARLALAEQLAKLLGDGKPAQGKPAPAEAQKVIRDSFTIPENEYLLIAKLQERAMDIRLRVTKSELLRAGLQALEAMPNQDLRELLLGLEKLKPGRKKQ
jgi:hypothetical protein